MRYQQHLNKSSPSEVITAIRSNLTCTRGRCFFNGFVFQSIMPSEFVKSINSLNNQVIYHNINYLFLLWIKVKAVVLGLSKWCLDLGLDHSRLGQSCSFVEDGQSSLHHGNGRGYIATFYKITEIQLNHHRTHVLHRLQQVTLPF